MMNFKSILATTVIAATLAMAGPAMTQERSYKPGTVWPASRFYPGVLLYLSQRFPANWLCRAVSRFYIANPISFMMMGSIAGLLMSLDGALGVAGWQWMLLVEAVPALVIAAMLLLFLPERIETTN